MLGKTKGIKKREKLVRHRITRIANMDVKITHHQHLARR
jgi:hypothetical protein